jgi:hypothetical protein
MTALRNILGKVTVDHAKSLQPTSGINVAFKAQTYKNRRINEVMNGIITHP